MNRLAIDIFLTFVVAFLTSCSMVEKRPLTASIPVQCDVATPERPELSGNAVEDNLKIMKYIKELEQSLAFCKK